MAALKDKVSPKPEAKTVQQATATELVQELAERGAVVSVLNPPPADQESKG